MAEGATLERAALRADVVLRDDSWNYIAGQALTFGSRSANMPSGFFVSDGGVEDV
jgi:hypothetical protein